MEAASQSRHACPLRASMARTDSNGSGWGEPTESGARRPPGDQDSEPFDACGFAVGRFHHDSEDAIEADFMVARAAGQAPTVGRELFHIVSRLPLGGRAK